MELDPKRRDYDVTLDIEAVGLSKVKFAQLLGIKHSQFLTVKSKIKKDTYIFKICSDCESHLPIIDHIKSILPKVNADKSICRNSAIKHVCLSIGVMYRTYTCTVDLPNECFSLLFSHFPDISVQIVCYPTSEDEAY